MPVLVVKCAPIAYAYMRGLRSRGDHPNGLMVVFDTTVLRRAGAWVIDIKSNMPPFYYFGLLIILAGVGLSGIIHGWSFLIIAIGGLLLSTVFFETYLPYKWALIAGMKRHAGVKPDQVLVVDEAARWLLYGTDSGL